jgi:transketolase C-terminal domain/subunit
MEGNRGLVYARIPRAPTRVVHEAGARFEFGQGYRLRQPAGERAIIVTSGRGIYEALEAASLLEKEGIAVGVIDMPSLDEELVAELYEGEAKVIVAEQNNGLLWQGCQRALWQRLASVDPGRIAAVNCLDEAGHPRFIHSATYKQLLEAYGLSPQKLAARVKQELAR